MELGAANWSRTRVYGVCETEQDIIRGCAGDFTGAVAFLSPELGRVFKYRQAEGVDVRHLNIIKDLNRVGVRFKWVCPEDGLTLAALCRDVGIVDELDTLNQSLRVPGSVRFDVVDGQLASLRDMEVLGAGSA